MKESITAKLGNGYHKGMAIAGFIPGIAAIGLGIRVSSPCAEPRISSTSKEWAALAQSRL